MLTSSLDIPNKPSEQPSRWSIRHLLSLGGSMSKVVSTFNPFEFIFFVMILISGLAEIIDSDISWFWYVILFLVLLTAFYQRQYKIEPEKKPDEPKKT